MTYYKKISLCLAALLFFTLTLVAQSSITGQVIDPETTEPLSNVRVQVQDANLSATTDKNGYFKITNVAAGEWKLSFSDKEKLLFEQEILVEEDKNYDIGIVSNNSAGSLQSLDMPIVTLETEEIGDLETSDVSGLLSSSRELFESTAGFTFGIRRFRVRGLGSEEFTTSLNGVAQNDLESGRVFWGAWGGLNDVVRNQQISIGLNPVDFAFGGIGGSTNINTFASTHRVQKKISYASTNQGYRNRIMGTWSTGMRPNGWAVTLSGSRRWAQEGYIDGTFYDAWSFFGSVDKKLNNHLLNLTVLGAPRKTGSGAASVQEMNDLAGSNYYNSNWGYQSGEKRNARVRESFQPIFMLSDQWNINESSTLSSSISYQNGKSGSTALDWYNAADPRPDYYRKLPSYQLNEELAEQVADALRNNEELRQLDWHSFYEINRANNTTVTDVSNVEGGTITGNRSNYIIEDRRYDAEKINFNTVYNNFSSDNFSFTAGLNYNYYKGDYFKEVVDLLGGDFYIDIDKFAERDLPGDNDVIQNDLNNPNRAVKEGDRLGYSYEPNIRKGAFWTQGIYTFNKLDAGLGLELSNTQFWRVGNYKNGKFPDSSFGESEKQNFTNYGVKGHLTYKLDGRNYFNLNSTYRTRAPFFRNAYLSPRTRDELVNNLTDTKIFSSDIGYFHRSPKYKIRASAYYTTIKDENEAYSFYYDLERAFVNYIQSGIDREHLGVELAASAKITTTLTAHAVVALGQYIYTSRPTVTIAQDNTAELLAEDQTIYAKNFYVDGTPQRAYNIGLTYESPKFYRIYLNLSYLDDMYVGFDPARRTTNAVEGLDPSSDLFKKIIYQEKGDGKFMLDISAVKSWKWGKNYVSLNLSVNNLLDVTDFKTGGYEQRRFDYEDKNVDRFSNRYFYAFGRTYFASISYSF